MRDYKDLWEWEYECYKGRKVNPYMVWYMVTIIVWAILIVAVLWTANKHAEVPVASPPVEEKIEEVHTEPAIYITEAANDRIEEPDERIEEPVEEVKLNQFETAKITAYCICKKCCGKDPDHPAYGITASGREAVPYVSVAVDRKLIPLGSTVYIDYGDGVVHEFRADDVGGGVKGEHIDVCYPDHQSALVHGVKTARVWWEEE